MSLQWKFNGSKPVYAQIMDIVKSAILMGEYVPGGRIPPVRDLAFQAQVNPNTMQRAMLELEREGLLVTQGTLGRFVTDDPAILAAIRQDALNNVVRSCAEQFRSIGLNMEQAAAMLLALDTKEVTNG